MQYSKLFYAKTREGIAKRKRKVENDCKGGDDSLTLCVPLGTMHEVYVNFSDRESFTD